MSQYLETLDQRESLGKHWLASLVFHVGVIALFALSGLQVRKPGDSWGSLNPGGGAVSVGTVKTVPLPPPKAKPEPKAKAQADDATPIPGKKADKRTTDRASEKTKYRAPGRD